jgi:cell division GTPase FtsZ
LRTIARRVLIQNFKELSLAVKTLKFSTESSKAMTELQSEISSLREEKKTSPVLWILSKHFEFRCYLLASSS